MDKKRPFIAPICSKKPGRKKKKKKKKTRISMVTIYLIVVASKEISQREAGVDWRRSAAGKKNIRVSCGSERGNKKEEAGN